MEERGGERKGGMEEGARPADTHTQDEESLSSIPLSFPDASGYTCMYCRHCIVYLYLVPGLYIYRAAWNGLVGRVPAW